MGLAALRLSYACEVGAYWQETSALQFMDLSRGLLSVLMTWWLPPEVDHPNLLLSFQGDAQSGRIQALLDGGEDLMEIYESGNSGAELAGVERLLGRCGHRQPE